jgi:hypothetical protein
VGPAGFMLRRNKFPVDARGGVARFSRNQASFEAESEIPVFTSPMMQSQQFVETWAKLSADQLTRMAELTAQVGELQAKALERTCAAIDESARLMKESLAATTKLTEEWRTIAQAGAAKMVDVAEKAAPAAKA